MNILPHKSWHIWNKDNLEKIAKDEAENAAKEAQELKRKQSVELEARVEELKRRRRSDNVTDVGNSDIRTKQESESSDLLHELLDGPKEKRHLDFLLPPVNEEAEAEKQEAKMKEMKKFTSYLGDGSIETSQKKPWYFQHEEKVLSEVEKKKDEKLKKHLDPMEQFTKVLDKKREKEKGDHHKKEKEKEKHKSKSSTTKTGSTETKGISAIEKLRQERLEREKKEAERVRDLLHPVRKYFAVSLPS
eukprot:TRINITY_DN6480_c0_g1_i6.p1 TRINITY_DN6480_c0_g1~~TRINITY_DN6480_c0_g1_i6.p1  ORF type:complete len:246 (+),score=64.77 TRINITY_DN6480_c0_g1_i6:72-809(+)